MRPVRTQGGGAYAAPGICRSSGHPPPRAGERAAPLTRRGTMRTGTDVIAGVGLADRPRKSRWPARMDLAQSLSGLVLGLFMWGHMFFVSSILVSKDFMWTITKMFEGYFFFGRAFPGHRFGDRRGDLRAHRAACVPRDAEVPGQLSPVPDLHRPPQAPGARGHDAVVGAGRHRVRALLPGVRCTCTRC